MLSYAHFDNMAVAPAVVDRPGVTPATSDNYASSVRSRAIAVIQKLPASVDVALISLDPKGAVTVQTHNSNDTQIETSKNKKLSALAKEFAGLWSNELSIRAGLQGSSTSPYQVLLVRSVSTTDQYGAAIQQMDTSTASELTDHVTKVASEALAKVSK